MGGHQPPNLGKGELMGTGGRRGLLEGCSQTQHSYKHNELTSVVVSIACHFFRKIPTTFMPWILLCYSFPQ